MNRKFFVLFVFVALLVGCSQKNIPEHFDEIERTTPTKQFFIKNVVAKDKTIFEIDGKTCTALDAFEKYKQTRNAVQKEMINSQNEIIGQLYAIERYRETDTRYKFENLRFNHFIIYADNDNNTVGFKLYSESQKLTDLIQFINKYNLTAENWSDADFELQDSYYVKLENKTIDLKITKVRTAAPSPMSITDTKSLSSNIETKTLDKYSPAVELTVMFTNLGFELEDYFKKNENFR